MKNKYLIPVSAVLCASILTASSSFAVEDQEELYPTISKQEEGLLYAEEEGEKFNMDFTASLTGGYDTNIELEHYDPPASFFIQETFGARGTYALSDLLTLKAGYDITSINYFRTSEPNLLDNVVTAGLDAKFAEDFKWSLDYIFDLAGFPHDEKSEYAMNAVEAALRQDITGRLYQKVIYRFSHKHYPKWKTRANNGTTRLGDRKDARNTFEHRLGFYLTDRTFIRADNTLYLNNSNEAFLDYYDYRAIKTKGTIVHLITEKFYTVANAAYQYKAYKNRVVSDKVEGDQRDHLFIGGASLFYDIDPAVSIGTSFDYRRNFSNEGARRYADYIISGGVYTRF